MIDTRAITRLAQEAARCQQTLQITMHTVEHGVYKHVLGDAQ